MIVMSFRLPACFLDIYTEGKAMGYGTPPRANIHHIHVVVHVALYMTMYIYFDLSSLSFGPDCAERRALCRPLSSLPSGVGFDT